MSGRFQEKRKERKTRGRRGGGDDGETEGWGARERGRRRGKDVGSEGAVEVYLDWTDCVPVFERLRLQHVY